ncbi:uncharacterized protein LOC143375103 [Andrena cerasifolii]|uniref:uncharacterized protein LOC143375103 n=1 Tax=Andrena cerasifolii TaxID=2819439 RepID=UPI004037CACA
MIIQWPSMMENLSDVYYLVQLIVRQIFVYIRDLILHKFLWLATNKDHLEASDSKLRSLTSRNITADILAFGILCTVLFFLVVLASKCEKDHGARYASAAMETCPSLDMHEDSRCISSSSSTTCFLHACGDGKSPRGRFTKRNFSDGDFARVRSGTRMHPTSILKKSIFGLSAAQPQSSQSTQTTVQILQKTNHRWLLRRTRSGQVYGKYPV